MSIGKRVIEAFDKMVASDSEGALFQICAAIEETAKREGRKRGRGGYKEFLSDNIPIIAKIGIGPALAGIEIRCNHPELPKSSDGTYKIEDIVYHLVRCGLYHSASLPDGLHITDNRIGSDKEGNILIPKTIITGLIVAVVASPANKNECIKSNHYLSFEDKKYFLNDLWGEREKIMNSPPF